MPATQIRIVFSDATQVWTETFYRYSNDLRTSMSYAVLLAEARLPLLGSDCRINCVRASNDPPNRDVILAGVNRNQGTSPVSMINNAVSVRLEGGLEQGTTGYHCTRLIRGLPKALTQGSGGNPGKYEPRLKALLLGWLQVLVDLGFSMKCTSHSNPSVEIAAAVTVAESNRDVAGNPLFFNGFYPGGSTLFVTTRTPFDVPFVEAFTGSLPHVRISGTVAKHIDSGVVFSHDGMYPVVGRANGGVFVPSAPGLATKLISTGKIKLLETVYPLIRRYELLGVTTKKTGGRSSYHDVYPPWNGAQKHQIDDPLIPQSPVVDPPIPGTITGNPSQTLSNAREVYGEITEGYVNDETGTSHPIGIAQALNYDNVWVVFVSGTSLKFNQATFLPEDISSALGTVDTFSLRIIQVVQQTVPKGARLLLTGTSLGGMELQHVVLPLKVLGYSPSWLVCYGSPMTAIPNPFVHNSMFQLFGDLVPNLSPMGLALAAVGHPEQTKLSQADIGIGPIESHTGYFKALELNAYSPFGYLQDPANPDSLKIGPVQRFTVPRR